MPCAIFFLLKALSYKVIASAPPCRITLLSLSTLIYFLSGHDIEYHAKLLMATFDALRLFLIYYHDAKQNTLCYNSAGKPTAFALVEPLSCRAKRYLMFRLHAECRRAPRAQRRFGLLRSFQYLLFTFARCRHF